MSADTIEADLSVKYPGFALEVALRLPAQGVSVLLGPSGCGKTTVLRALAGLGDATQRASGRVQVRGEVWQDDARRIWRPVHQRPIGVVFQEASLFEHLSVQDNLDYGWRRVPAAQRRLQHDDIIPLLGIGHLLSRRPQGLSGGERQRVAIARALLTSPALLLMDEPLSALDAARKAEVMPCLERLGQTGVPVVYVTHALDEAARLADHLVLMRDGRVQAAGPAEALWTRLDTPLSASDEAAAVLSATVAAHDALQGLSLLRVDGVGEGEGKGPQPSGGHIGLWVGLCEAPLGAPIRLRVPARDVSLSLSRAQDSSILNILPAVVVGLGDDAGSGAQGHGPGEGLGDGSRHGPTSGVVVRLRLGTACGASDGGPHLLARVTRRSVAHLGLHVGQTVFAQVKGVALLRH